VSTLHLLSLRYTASEREAGPFVAAHIEFLERHHRDGTFLVSGQTVPSAQGGAIVAAGIDRDAVERITAEDPFVVAGVAAYTITTVDPARTHPALAGVVRDAALVALRDEGQDVVLRDG
jgi:uncharacterized protein YciI